MKMILRQDLGTVATTSFNQQKILVQEILKQFESVIKIDWRILKIHMEREIQMLIVILKTLGRRKTYKAMMMVFSDF